MKYIYNMFVLIMVMLISETISSCNKEKKSKSVSEKLKTTTIEKEEPTDFNDFYYQFMIDKAFQLKHIAFPITQNGQLITKENWIYKPLFAHKDALVTITKDTNSVVSSKEHTINIINLEKQHVSKYHYFYKNNKWMLSKITKQDFNVLKEHPFLLFLKKFASNQIVQKAHTKFPYRYVYTNSDYETDTLQIKTSNWEFKKLAIELLQIPDENTASSDQYLLTFSGIENGIAVSFLFKKIDTIWYLIEHQDFSS